MTIPEIVRGTTRRALLPIPGFVGGEENRPCYPCSLLYRRPGRFRSPSRISATNPELGGEQKRGSGRIGSPRYLAGMWPGYSMTLPEMIRISPLSPPSSLETPTTVFSPEFKVRFVLIKVVVDEAGLEF